MYAAQVEVRAEGLSELHKHYKQSNLVQQSNITMEDQNWALDCVHSRSFGVPQPVSKSHSLSCCIYCCFTIGFLD